MYFFINSFTAGSVIRMAANFLGDTAFRNGLTAYLNNRYVGISVILHHSLNGLLCPLVLLLYSGPSIPIPFKSVEYAKAPD